jgi:hypothetical protein
MAGENLTCSQKWLLQPFQGLKVEPIKSHLTQKIWTKKKSTIHEGF